MNDSFLQEQGVSGALIESVRRFRESYPVAEGLENRMSTPEIPFFGKEILEMAIAALLQGENLLLTGEKATGKNVLAETCLLYTSHTALTKTWLYSPMGLKAVGLGAILFVTGMCIYGMVHAVHIYTTRYEVPSKKDAHLKIALVADLHLGYSIGSHQMEEMVEKINAEEPDVVVIAGDIFDNEYDAIYEPDRVADLLAGLKSRYGKMCIRDSY